MVHVPVTADIESGFGATPKEVAETLAMVAEAGAVGVNIEDTTAEAPGTLRAVEDQSERLAAAREGAGPDLFINARIDMYLAGIGEEADRFDATVARAEAYAQAGADGIFVPGVSDPAGDRRARGGDPVAAQRDGRSGLARAVRARSPRRGPGEHGTGSRHGRL